MTPEEHNRALGICHLVYGGLHTLLMFAMALFMFAFLRMIPNEPHALPPQIFLIFGILFLFYSLFFTLPSFVAGYAMLKRKSWARTASIIAAVLEAMNVPIGTAVCIYSFWFLFSDAGRAMYDNKAADARRPYSLHDAPPSPLAD